MAQSRELEGPPLGTRASGKIDFTVRRTSRSVFKPPPRSPLYLAFHSRCYCAYLSPSALCSSVLNRSARLFAPRSVDCPPSASDCFDTCAQRAAALASGRAFVERLPSSPPARLRWRRRRTIPSSAPPRRFGQGENNRSCSRRRPRRLPLPLVRRRVTKNFLHYESPTGEEALWG